MEESDKKEWLIHQKITGTLTQEEETAYENYYAKDATFREAVEEEMQLAKVLNKNNRTDYQDFKDNLRHIVDTESSTTEMPTPKSFNWYRSAAVIALVAVAGGLGYFVWDTPADRDQLYTQYYQTYQAPGTLRAPNSDSLTNILPWQKQYFDGLAAYRVQHYSEALAHLEVVIADKPNNPEARFYAAMCQMELENFKQAHDGLAMVAKQPDHLYIQQAEWYQALCLVKMNDWASAKPLLAQIAQGEGYRKQAAEELLAQMK